MAGIEIATGELFDKHRPTQYKKLHATLRNLLLHKLMTPMPAAHRNRWCNSSACACMGAANCCGGLTEHGFTEKEWSAWLERNAH